MLWMLIRYLFWPFHIARAWEAYAEQAHRHAEEAIEDFARQMRMRAN
jgi:hypothetical protein